MRSETKKTTAADDKEEELDEAVTEAVPSPLKLPDAPPQKEKKTAAPAQKNLKKKLAPPARKKTVKKRR